MLLCAIANAKNPAQKRSRGGGGGGRRRQPLLGGIPVSRHKQAASEDNRKQTNRVSEEHTPQKRSTSDRRTNSALSLAATVPTSVGSLTQLKPQTVGIVQIFLLFQYYELFVCPGHGIVHRVIGLRVHFSRKRFLGGVYTFSRER